VNADRDIHHAENLAAPLSGQQPRSGLWDMTKSDPNAAMQTLAAVPTWKRMLDVSLVIITTPFTIPIGVIIYVFIKIASPGPAFFRQQRVGLMGRRFMCLKFRSMKVDADTGVHQAHLKQLMKANQPTRKLDCAGDKRLIPGGAWLRASGLDELPQLFNVLCGEMSLAGPRPCTPYEYDLYTARHKQRCEAPPGLTGLWQVSGKNNTTFEQMIDMDLKYVREKSLWLDLMIIARTIPAIMLLIWEMKIRPRLGFQPGAGKLKATTEIPADPPAPLPGSLPARD
jgi:exopolysaccharide production protein ExoY